MRSPLRAMMRTAARPKMELIEGVEQRDSRFKNFETDGHYRPWNSQSSTASSAIGSPVQPNVQPPRHILAAPLKELTATSKAKPRRSVSTSAPSIRLTIPARTRSPQLRELSYDEYRQKGFVGRKRPGLSERASKDDERPQKK